MHKLVARTIWLPVQICQQTFSTDRSVTFLDEKMSWESDQWICVALCCCKLQRERAMSLIGRLMYIAC